MSGPRHALRHTIACAALLAVGACSRHTEAPAPFCDASKGSAIHGLLLRKAPRIALAPDLGINGSCCSKAFIALSI